MKKVLSLILAMIMVLSISAVPALAADAQYVEFDGVFTLGDSNAMGYGLRGYKGGEVDENGTLIEGTEYTNSDYLHSVHGSFQDIVRQGLGLPWEKTWSMNYPAMRISDALFYLDASDADYYHDMAYDYRLINIDKDAYGDDFVYDRTGTVVDNAKSVFISRLQGFDHPLIINQLANSDVFFSLMELAFDDIAKNGTDDIPAIIENMVSLFWEKHSEFRANYPTLIKRLQELSPNGVIVLVGMFNSFKDMVIMDDSILPVFNALQPLYDVINSDIQAFAEEYNCLYADVSNTETLTSIFDVSLADITNGFDVEKVYHGSPEGYAYMARQILRQVEVNTGRLSTNIELDLGSVRKVTSVTLDGKSVSGWTYDEENRELTVPCRYTNATTLTVTGEQNNNISVAVYSLKWSSRNGYTATELYVTHNAVASVTKVSKTATNVLTSVAKAASKTIKNSIGKLFK